MLSAVGAKWAAAWGDCLPTVLGLAHGGLIAALLPGLRLACDFSSCREAASVAKVLPQSADEHSLIPPAIPCGGGCGGLRLLSIHWQAAFSQSAQGQAWVADTLARLPLPFDGAARQFACSTACCLLQHGSHEPQQTAAFALPAQRRTRLNCCVC